MDWRLVCFLAGSWRLGLVCGMWRAGRVCTAGPAFNVVDRRFVVF
jgi:hypothetical protein